MIRLVKREEVKKSTNIKIRILSIVIAILIAGIFLLILGNNPVDVFGGMIKGALGSPNRIRQTIIVAIPLVIASIGVGVAFKMLFWNIGGEGQIFMGAFGAAIVALNFTALPKPILLLFMCLAAIICGGLWAMIAGFLKVYFNTNETIITLMLNYVALKFITLLQFDLLKDKNAMGFPKIANFADKALLPKLFGVHIGWIIALIIVVVFFIFMNHSKLGYEIAVLGESKNTAKYAGININKTIFKAVFISGALCGLVGFIQASAVSQTLSIEVTNGVGNTAIIIAWLANLNAIFTLVVSFLFGVLIQGGAYIQTAFGIPNAAASVIQALVLFCVLAGEMFIRYKIDFKGVKR
ncbi:ABC transporter permease [Clostridium sp. 'White wine YQ']|uniref:ABC transporter permease n=1 Tax=Clostridium sp. 'White wine YQ' TaxID=3027474 RepID=UPI002365BC0A|nr:ABC transporter permease [Clostridium sp. 'White wine YQ']MDD7794656.1 ABC transporter permease [Clostridium sp. 'White wine YQ']